MQTTSQIVSSNRRPEFSLLSGDSPTPQDATVKMEFSVGICMASQFTLYKTLLKNKCTLCFWVFVLCVSVFCPQDFFHPVGQQVARKQYLIEESIGFREHLWKTMLKDEDRWTWILSLWHLGDVLAISAGRYVSSSGHLEFMDHFFVLHPSKNVNEHIHLSIMMF